MARKTLNAWGTKQNNKNRMSIKIETTPEIRLLNKTVADFDEATNGRFHKMTDYRRLAFLSKEFSRFDWAEIFERHIPRREK
jgi:hypothetical protein